MPNFGASEKFFITMAFFQLKSLSSDQRDRLLDVPLYITLYVGVADGTLHHEEIEWAEHVADFRAQHEDSLLAHYWIDVDNRFRKRFYEIQRAFGIESDRPVNGKEVMQEIEQWLKDIPSLYPLLPEGFDVELYESWRSFARHVARASGGILGFGAITGEEERAILTLEAILQP